MNMYISIKRRISSELMLFVEVKFFWVGIYLPRNTYPRFMRIIDNRNFLKFLYRWILSWQQEPNPRSTLSILRKWSLRVRLKNTSRDTEKNHQSCMLHFHSGP